MPNYCNGVLDLVRSNFAGRRLGTDRLRRSLVLVDQSGGQHAVVCALLDRPNVAADEVALQVLDQRPG